MNAYVLNYCISNTVKNNYFNVIESKRFLITQ